jgi:hypothetical protein
MSIREVASGTSTIDLKIPSRAAKAIRSTVTNEAAFDVGARGALTVVEVVATIAGEAGGAAITE